ncbi:MAG: glycosyltransferase [bacterium]
MGPSEGTKPRDLLIVTTDSVIAGTERMILAYLERHDPSKYRPRLVTVVGPGDLSAAARDMGIAAQHLNARTAFGAAAKLCSLIWRTRPAIVHSYLFHTNILTRLLRMVCPIPSLVCGMRTVYFQGAYPDWYHKVDGFTHKLCNRIIANSEAGRDSLVQMAGIPVEKIDVVPNGVDAERLRFDRSMARERLAAEFSLPSNACLFGIVAQLRPRKHHDLLFRAMRIVREKESRVHLLVVGDGAERERLESLRRELGLESDVTLTGYRSDVREILAGLDALVLPTSLEGCPVSVMEAMAAGLPVIAAKAGGVAELVEDQRTGLLIEPGNEESLTRAILSLVENPALRSKLGEAGREKIEKEFSLDRMAKQIENVYDAL